MTNEKLPGQWRFHLLAIMVVLIWGGTFINSKILLLHGLEAHEIFALRFFFSYLCIWTISPHKLWADSMRDELLLMLLGITGGSLYFVTENEAVRIDYVNNVAFIVCTAPLLTTLLALAFLRGVRATRQLILGAIAATLGVALVVFNGQFMLQLNPLGDMLALCASLSWAAYSLLLRRVSGYNVVFVTRKVFFYGIVTVLPMFVFRPWTFPLEGFLLPAVWGNLLFLGLVASFGCFVLWSWVSKRLGALTASNYIYLNPVSTVIFSALFLNERLTWLSFLGSALILLGVYLSNQGTRAQQEGRES
jgi:drug/metabolite transporter (DMT)-like permease